jgi:ribonuclease HI
MEGPDLILCTDGGASPNPGPGALGVVLCAPDGTILRSFGRFLGETTNNQAEYRAVAAALQAAARRTGGWVEVRSDSELLVNQLNGTYKVRKAERAALHGVVVRLSARFMRVTFAHRPREDRCIARTDGQVRRARARALAKPRTRRNGPG